jgi:hypothetical protein
MITDLVLVVLFVVLSAFEVRYENRSSRCLFPRLPPNKHRLALIIPFRDGCSKENQGGGRTKNLEEFVPYMMDFLRKQKVNFTIVVVEQVNKGHFNRGFLFNVGFLLTKDNFDYFAFHDVDLLPENALNSYGYPTGNRPYHLCVANSRQGYKPAYGGKVGGVLLINLEHYDALNGFSNTFWGWGQEDDEMAARIKGILGGVNRPSAEIGRYKALDHGRVAGLDATEIFRKQRTDMLDMMAASHRGRFETEKLAMLNGFRQIEYTARSVRCLPHFKHYIVNYLNPNKPMKDC